MSCGDTRGLLDMTIAFDKNLVDNLILLKREEKIGDFHQGICTESGKYECANTECIYDYNPTNTISRLGLEHNVNNAILNETQKYISAETIDNSKYAIQLTPEKWLSSSMSNPKLIDEYNKRKAKIHVIYEFERKPRDNAKTVLIETSTNDELLPLYDIIDICIKSQFKKSKINTHIPGNLIYNDISKKYNKNVDIYIDFESYPIDFCQCNNGAFVLSQPMTMQPYMLKSALNVDNIFQNTHSFQLQQKPIQTFLYKEVRKYASNAKTYFQALSANAAFYASSENALALYEPSTSLVGIDYNYVIGIDQMSNKDALNDNPTIYDNGDVFGSISLAKNMYSPLYSMEMPNNSSLQKCRMYCGIQNSQNMVLLKYYDNVDYRFVPQNKDIDGNTEVQQIIRNSGKYPYQKVEFFQPNLIATQTKHKSNLFSIQIVDSGLDDYSIENNIIEKNVASQIKRDIFNGIKTLAESIAPANTQLFKAYYVES